MSDYQKRFVYFLPNTFTALNMGCGFASIMCSIQGLFYPSCVLLTLGAVFDSVDGRIARITGTQSSFGEQFDSMSDLISFGLAPALLFYLRFLFNFGRIGMALTFIFLLFAALRLARFNANLDKISSEYFQGLPTPISALALVGYTLFSFEFSTLEKFELYSFIYILFYSFLMISNIPFPSFKNSKWVKTHKKESLLIIFFILGSILIYEKIMILILLSLYVLISFVNYVLNWKKLRGLFNLGNDAENP